MSTYQVIELTIVGLSIVFSVLALTALMISLIKKVDEGWVKEEKIEKAQLAEKEPTRDATTVVIIAAAVAAIVGKRKHSIRKIKLLRRNKNTWSLAGRQNIMGSHGLNKSGGK